MGEHIILHVDMDAFFASVEEAESPELKSKPVIIGADPKEGKGRGVVSTANYEARKYGIHSAMPISLAYRKCPNAVFLPVSMPKYVAMSNQIMEVLRGYSDVFQQVSIDEAFIELTNKVAEYKEAEEIGIEIKHAIKKKFHLTCSVGIGPNKLVAKIASDAKKPDGLTVIQPEKVQKFLFQLPVRKLPGVGAKTEALLQDRGIMTIGQLAKIPEQALTKEFGMWGHRLHHAANGRDESEVREEEGLKSVSRFRTFEEDTKDEDMLTKEVVGLCKEAFKSLAKNGLQAKTVGVKIRYSDFETHTKEKTNKYAFKSVSDVTEEALNLLRGFLQSKKQVRLVGVRLSHFEPQETGQMKIEEFEK